MPFSCMCCSSRARTEPARTHARTKQARKHVQQDNSVDDTTAKSRRHACSRMPEPHLSVVVRHQAKVQLICRVRVQRAVLQLLAVHNEAAPAVHKSTRLQSMNVGDTLPKLWCPRAACHFPAAVRHTMKPPSGAARHDSFVNVWLTIFNCYTKCSVLSSSAYEIQ